MSNRAKFYDLPTEPPPLNRRIYASAKVPFRYLWAFVVWALMPWFKALPWALAASAAVSLSAVSKSDFPGWARFATDTLSVGLVWTLYLGAMFLLVKGLRRVFE